MGDRVGTLGVRSISAVVREASASGGEIHDVLNVVSAQRRDARELDAERRRTMGLYVAIIYIASLVFLGILLMLATTFLPSLAAAGAQATSGGLPAGGPLAFPRIDLLEYRKLFLLAGFVQGVGDGIVAGVMSTGRLQSGLKHAFILGVASVLAFTIMMPPGGL